MIADPKPRCSRLFQHMLLFSQSGWQDSNLSATEFALSSQERRGPPGMPMSFQTRPPVTLTGALPLSYNPIFGAAGGS